MDLKSKSRTWVGSFCQKFETVCQEMDNIVSQDAVKYLEDQVHNVGVSMKKLYSDVVQDIMPSTGPVNCEAQAMTQQRNADIRSYIESIIVIKEDHAYTSPLTQSHGEPSDFNLVINPRGNGFRGLHPLNQSTGNTFGEVFHRAEYESVPGSSDDVSTNENSNISTEEITFKGKTSESEVLEGAKSESVPGSIDDISMNENSCISAEENTFKEKPSESEVSEGAESALVPRSIDDVSKSENSCISTDENTFKEKSSESEGLESMSAGDKESFQPTSEFLDCNCENTCHFLVEVLPSSTVHGETFQYSQNVEAVCLNPVNNSHRVCDASANAHREKYSAPEMLELLASGMKKASGEFIDYRHTSACGFLAEVSPPTSIYGDKYQSPQNMGLGAVCCKSADDSCCVSNTAGTVSLSEMGFPVVSDDKKFMEKELASFCSSILSEHYSLSQNPLDNIHTKLGSCSYHSIVATHDSNSSSLLLCSTSAPTVSREIKEMGLDPSNGVPSLESVGCYDDTSDMTDDITGSGMETIDLTDEVKLEESCVIVYDSLLHEVSQRIRKFSSYKEKIRDAFTSKKRLTKEYEQLAIWYGDLDLGSSLDMTHSENSTTVTLDSNLQTQGTNDCEWELL